MHQTIVQQAMHLVPPSNIEGTLTSSDFSVPMTWDAITEHITVTTAVSCSTRLRSWDHYTMWEEA